MFSKILERNLPCVIAWVRLVAHVFYVLSILKEIMFSFPLNFIVFCFLS